MSEAKPPGAEARWRILAKESFTRRGREASPWEIADDVWGQLGDDERQAVDRSLHGDWGRRLIRSIRSGSPGVPFAISLGQNQYIQLELATIDERISVVGQYQRRGKACYAIARKIAANTAERYDNLTEEDVWQAALQRLA